MSEVLDAVAAARPGVRLREVPGPPDETVLHGGGEVLRVPRTAEAAARHAVLVKALPVLRNRVPVPVAPPRYTGVLPDGATPFLAEPRLPGVPLSDLPGHVLSGIALGQLNGLLFGLSDVAEREAAQWGVPGSGALLHGALTPAALLVDPARGLLTGVVGWQPRLGDPAEDLAGLPELLRAALY